jgi:Pyruvate/2-oxoacid:ferredoxin oxidoreductase gamma subunit
MLGALIAEDLLPLTQPEIESEIREDFPGSVELNIRAFRKGMEAVQPAGRRVALTQ